MNLMVIVLMNPAFRDVVLRLTLGVTLFAAADKMTIERFFRSLW